MCGRHFPNSICTPMPNPPLPNIETGPTISFISEICALTTAKPRVTRKMGSDSEGNLWVGLHVPGKLMKVDYKTTQMTIFDPPTEDSGVYSVQGDAKSKLIWFSQQHADQIARFDPATRTFTEFSLANAEEDHRRIEIDPSNSNRIWWTGNTSGRIGYVELLK